MAENQYVNKVVYNGQTVIDISDSSFNPSRLPLGNVAYAASGERVVGEAIVYDIYKGSTEYWNERTTYVPKNGDVIIYEDRETIEENGVTKNVPGIKIGDGNAYVVDLPFMDDAQRTRLLNHITNTDIHVTTLEKAFWNAKLNCSVSGEELSFNRN